MLPLTSTVIKEPAYELVVTAREAHIMYRCLCYAFEAAAEAKSSPFADSPVDNHSDYEALANMIEIMRKTASFRN